MSRRLAAIAAVIGVVVTVAPRPLAVAAASVPAHRGAPPATVPRGAFMSTMLACYTDPLRRLSAGARGCSSVPPGPLPVPPTPADGCGAGLSARCPTAAWTFNAAPSGKETLPGPAALGRDGWLYSTASLPSNDGTYGVRVVGVDLADATNLTSSSQEWSTDYPAANWGDIPPLELSVDRDNTLYVGLVERARFDPSRGRATIIAIAREPGRKGWTFTTGSDSTLTVPTQLSVQPGRLVIDGITEGGGGGHAFSIVLDSATGRQLSHIDYATGNAELTRRTTDGRTLIAVHASANDGHLTESTVTAFDIATARRLWQAHLRNVAVADLVPSPTGLRLYASTVTTLDPFVSVAEVTAIDRQTGSILWRDDRLTASALDITVSPASPSSPVEDVIVSGSFMSSGPGDGTVGASDDYVIEAISYVGSTGSIRWQATYGDLPAARMDMADGAALYEGSLSEDGILYVVGWSASSVGSSGPIGPTACLVVAFDDISGSLAWTGSYAPLVDTGGDVGYRVVPSTDGSRVVVVGTRSQNAAPPTGSSTQSTGELLALDYELHSNVPVPAMRIRAI